MVKDAWDEIAEITIRLGWLERELAVSAPAHHAELIDAIREVTARRDGLMAALCERAGNAVAEQPTPPREPLLIGF